MKKFSVAAAIVGAAVCAHAANIGWSAYVGSDFKGDYCQLFVVGQKGVDSVDQINTLVSSGVDVSAYAFDVCNVGQTGLVGKAPGQVQSLGEGSYTSFMILYDTAEIVGGNPYYCLIQGLNGQTITIGTLTASATFGAYGASTVASDTTNWASAGGGEEPVPEPTSGLLLLLGVAGLALKRKQA